MKVSLVEKEKDFAKFEIAGESETLTVLIASKKPGEIASVREHPFMEEPKLVVKSKNPVKTVEEAVTEVLNDIKEFKKEFSRAVK
ncbi:MAG: hypothetical protein GXO63_00045 [Candidatus Micrarchaeota archaeon]|nr:hypothetical protein [Candidatus Micrarchaeota archaeon]